MMLPFLEPEHDIYLNLSIVLIIINTLGKTKRGAFKINNGKLHIFLYLIKNPTALNKILALLGESEVLLSEHESYSITSISPNIDPLFDRYALKALLSILVAKNLVEVVYKKNDGFFYILNEDGIKVAANFHDEYFLEVGQQCSHLKNLLRFPESQLNKTLNHIIRKESM